MFPHVHVRSWSALRGVSLLSLLCRFGLFSAFSLPCLVGIEAVLGGLIIQGEAYLLKDIGPAGFSGELYVCRNREISCQAVRL